MKNKFLFSVSFLIWTSLLLTIFISYIPETTFNLNAKIKITATNLFPQGWAFFTIDPQKEKVFFYDFDHDMKPLDTKTNSPSSFFGIQRSSRARSLEASGIVDQINDSSWNSCNKYIYDCFKLDTLKTISVSNKVINKSIFGNWILVKTKPLPWVWRNQSGKVYMPSKVVRISVY